MDKPNASTTSALMASFAEEEIESFKGRGSKMFPYIAGENVLRRLIAATDNCFDVDVLAIESRPIQTKNRDGVISDGEQWIARVQLTIPGLGRRTAIGVQNVDDRSGEDMIKGVITDGIKKAATYFGVGLQLYDDNSPANPQAPQGDTLAGEWAKFHSWLRGDAKLSPQDFARIVGTAANNFTDPRSAYLALIAKEPKYGKQTGTPSGGK